MEYACIGNDSAPRGTAALQQHPIYGATLRALGRDVRIVEMRDDDGVLGQVQLVQRRFGVVGNVALMSSGPVWQNDDPKRQSRALSGLMRDGFGVAPRFFVTNCASQIQSSVMARLGHLPLMSPAHVGEVCLCASDEERRAALHGKWRNRLRRAEGSALGVTHEVFDPLAHRWLLQKNVAHQRVARYRSFPPQFYLAMSARSPKSLRVLSLHQNGTVIAAILIALHMPTATHLIGWNTAAGRKVSAHHLLLWQASCWLHSRGFHRLDLGTIDTQDAPGLARFKIGFGAKVRPLGATMLYTRATRGLGRLAANQRREFDEIA